MQPFCDISKLTEDADTSILSFSFVTANYPQTLIRETNCFTPLTSHARRHVSVTQHHPMETTGTSEPRHKMGKCDRLEALAPVDIIQSYSK
jgi:hypothetical protein